MLNQEERVAKFIDAINQDAMDRQAEITQRTKDFFAEELRKAEEQAQLRAQTMIERERAKGVEESNRAIAKSTMEQRAVLAGKREELTQSIFSAAGDRLRAFTATDDYEQFLKNSAESFAKLFPEGDAVIRLRAEDMKYASAVKSAFGRACSVEQDDSITIGGCRCTNAGGVTADDTLDRRLEAQRRWFLENSGMKAIF